MIVTLNLEVPEIQALLSNTAASLARAEEEIRFRLEENGRLHERLLQLDAKLESMPPANYVEKARADLRVAIDEVFKARHERDEANKALLEAGRENRKLRRELAAAKKGRTKR